jgi:FkbM family methyltransferase
MLRRPFVKMAGLLPERIRLYIEVRHYVNLISRFHLENEPDLGVALKMVRAGDVVVDVGANVGLWTIPMARQVGQRGHVIAVEPIPSTFAILAKVTDELTQEPSNIELHNCAASNGTGYLQMDIPFDGRGMKNRYLARVIDEGNGIRVIKVDLDEICRKHNKIQFIKIDTEGHELAVIYGCLKTLKKDQRILRIEISTELDDPLSEGGRILHLLEQHGYQCYRQLNGTLKPRKRGEEAVNYFFLPHATQDVVSRK